MGVLEAFSFYLQMQDDEAQVEVLPLSNMPSQRDTGAQDEEHALALDPCGSLPCGNQVHM